MIPRILRKGWGLSSLLIVCVVVLFLGLYVAGIDAGPILKRTMMASTPLLFATLGEVYSERSGVLNLGIEGMMATGAVLGVAGAFAFRNAWAGAALAMLGGGLLAFGFGAVTIRLRGMQVPAGLGLFMFGLGISGIVGKGYVGRPLPCHFSSIPVPGLSKIPVFGEFLFQHGPLIYLALALVLIMWFILYKTQIGLIIRSVGENPEAVDSAGVNVFRVRYSCVVLGGVLAGLGGAFISLSWTPGWTSGMTAGRGWIAIALTIFALWDPVRALLGSWLFGGMFALSYELEGMGIPSQILGMMPYLLTIIALIVVLLFRERLGAPSALLQPYRRE